MSSTDSTTARTYEFFNETPTMGNLMRYHLQKHPAIDFAGYSIPHPAEATLNLRVQTNSGVTADKAVFEALDDVKFCCGSLKSKWRAAVQQHKSTQMAVSSVASTLLAVHNLLARGKEGGSL